MGTNQTNLTQFLDTQKQLRHTSHEKIKKGGFCGLQGIPSLKTDTHSLGTDTAALLRKSYIGHRLSIPADYHIQDT